MKLTLKQIVESQEALQNLMDQKLPAVTAYKLQRIIRAILNEVENFNKVRMDVVKRYGEPIEGQPLAYQVREENIQAYANEVNGMLEVEIELDIRPILLSELQSADMAIRDMLLLDYLIEEDSHD